VTKPNPENCKNCSSKCAYDCAQLQYTIQHRTVLIIFRAYLQTNIIAQMLSIGGEGVSVRISTVSNLVQINARGSLGRYAHFATIIFVYTFFFAKPTHDWSKYTHGSNL